MMNNLFNSFFSRISNLPSRNGPTFTGTSDVALKQNIEIVDLSYEDYMKYSNQQPRRKPIRLTAN